jgi:DNA-binding NtrC family response regulator
LEYYRGNYRKAREYYQQVLDMPEPTASAVAQTLRMLTDVYVAEGKWHKAASTAQKAEAAILKINERIELAALWRAYGQIHTHKGESETARDYFRKSIELLKEIGAKYELALSYFAAGESESYSFDERKRHLEMSRMLFVEMDVPKRVEQLDDALRKLREVAIPDVIEENGAPVIVASSEKMKRILSLVGSVAESDMNVLLTGETGTGKDHLAKYIHHLSGRSGEFVTVNAAAIPDDMVEAELFGYKRGAFTGAMDDKPGLLEIAEDGTFYLNEIADASSSFQAKLLEVLETREIRRLGETRKRRVDFRLVAATNHNIKERIREGKFRADLYHRLNEMSIHLPPLRDRREDIPHLVGFFVHALGNGRGADHDLDRLCHLMSVFDYAGNIRELKSRISVYHHQTGGDIERMVELCLANASLEEDELTERILRRVGNSQTKAAQILGMSQPAISRRIERWRLEGD